MKRNVSWESSCRQSPGSADQRRSPKHQIYSFLWVGEERYCFTNGAIAAQGRRELREKRDFAATFELDSRCTVKTTTAPVTFHTRRSKSTGFDGS